MRIDICNLSRPLSEIIPHEPLETVVYSSTFARAKKKAFNYQSIKNEHALFRKALHEVWIHVLKQGLVSDLQMDLLERKIDKVVASACFNLGKQITGEITVGDIIAIGQEIKDSLVAVGNKPEYSFSFEKDDNCSKHLLVALLLDEFPEVDKGSRERLLKAIFWEKDTKLLAESRASMKETLKEFFEIVSSQPSGFIGRLPQLPLEAAVGNLLAIYPFLDPQQGEFLSLPQKVGDTWHFSEYKIGRVALTPEFFPSPMYAYTLVAADPKENLPPILLFKGTTYPTDDGAFLSILSDLNPFASVGEYAFWMGKEKLQAWLNDVTSATNKARVYGMSLGGALSLQSAIAFASQIEFVHAYSPPALSNHNIRSWDATTGKKPDVFVYCNDGDVVPQFGTGWSRDWKVMDVIASEEYNPILSHCRIFTADDVILIERNVERDQESFPRRLFSTVQMVASLPMFCLLAVVFLSYTGVRKIFNI